MKLVIIGNGFDIHHNYKTSFSDFRQFLLGAKKVSLVNSIDDFAEKALSRNPKSKIKLDEILWNHFEELLTFYHPIRNLKRVKDMDIHSEHSLMIDFLDEFTEEFADYIKNITSKKSSVFNKNIARELGNADLIITFNYTDTHNLYQLPTGAQVVHINGSLEGSHLPIIGFHIEPPIKPSVDYLEKFDNAYYSKSALAYKRNTFDYNVRYKSKIKPFVKKIDEIVSIGFSYGNSDSHIESIIQQLIVPQQTSGRMPLQNYEKLKKITVKIFNYDSNETETIISKLRRFFPFTATTITGVGFRTEKRDLITFDNIDY